MLVADCNVHPGRSLVGLWLPSVEFQSLSTDGLMRFSILARMDMSTIVLFVHGCPEIVSTLDKRAGCTSEVDPPQPKVAQRSNTQDVSNVSEKHLFVSFPL